MRKVQKNYDIKKRRQKSDKRMRKKGYKDATKRDKNVTKTGDKMS